ncbi:MAG: hypothetical protein AB7P76_10445 [Candidatus Melainabacteria bacterium]
MMIHPMTFAARTRFYQGPPERELPVAEIHDELAAKAARRQERPSGSRMTPAEDPVARAMRMIERGNAAETLTALKGRNLSDEELHRLFVSAAKQGLTRVVHELAQHPRMTGDTRYDAFVACRKLIPSTTSYPRLTPNGKTIWRSTNPEKPRTEADRRQQMRLRLGMKVTPNRSDVSGAANPGKITTTALTAHLIDQANPAKVTIAGPRR